MLNIPFLEFSFPFNCMKVLTIYFIQLLLNVNVNLKVSLQIILSVFLAFCHFSFFKVCLQLWWFSYIYILFLPAFDNYYDLLSSIRYHVIPTCIKNQITPEFVKLYGIHDCIKYQVYKVSSWYCERLGQSDPALTWSFNTSLNLETWIF